MFPSTHESTGDRETAMRKENEKRTSMIKKHAFRNVINHTSRRPKRAAVNGDSVRCKSAYLRPKIIMLLLSPDTRLLRETEWQATSLTMNPVVLGARGSPSAPSKVKDAKGSISISHEKPQVSTAGARMSHLGGAGKRIANRMMIFDIGATWKSCSCVSHTVVGLRSTGILSECFCVPQSPGWAWRRNVWIAALFWIAGPCCHYELNNEEAQGKCGLNISQKHSTVIWVTGADLIFSELLFPTPLLLDHRQRSGKYFVLVASRLRTLVPLH